MAGYWAVQSAEKTAHLWAEKRDHWMVVMMAEQTDASMVVCSVVCLESQMAERMASWKVDSMDVALVAWKVAM